MGAIAALEFDAFHYQAAASRRSLPWSLTRSITKQRHPGDRCLGVRRVPLPSSGIQAIAALEFDAFHYQAAASRRSLPWSSTRSIIKQRHPLLLLL
jgi:hypothetical protein